MDIISAIFSVVIVAAFALGAFSWISGMVLNLWILHRLRKYPSIVERYGVPDVLGTSSLRDSWNFPWYILGAKWRAIDDPTLVRAFRWFRISMMTFVGVWLLLMALMLLGGIIGELMGPGFEAVPAEDSVSVAPEGPPPSSTGTDTGQELQDKKNDAPSIITAAIGVMVVLAWKLGPILVISSLLLWAWILHRLRIRHPSVATTHGLPSSLWTASGHEYRNFYRFLWGRKWRETDDLLLAWAIRLFLILLIASTSAGLLILSLGLLAPALFQRFLLG